jgi:serine/threonine protein kinase
LSWKKEKQEKEKEIEENNSFERCSVFIQPFRDDFFQKERKVCLEDFEIIKFIGKGACGRVKLVRKKFGPDEGVFYAMKSIRKKLVIERRLIEATNAERRILDRIKHPYIATLCYAFQNEAKLFLLSKYYPGGNLLDQMRLAKRFSEDRTRLYTAEVALALEHLHQNNIIYRDLKLENVLVDSEGHIALTDFGMSKENINPKNGRTSTFVGTYQMMAPEILSGNSYSIAVDWWALGVMVFEMIDGRTPFNAKTNKIIKERIINVDLKFSPRFNEEIKDFVTKLLTKEENKRLGNGPNGFEQIKNHTWFKGFDWKAIEKRQLLFEGQTELMKIHAKEYKTSDIFDTFMNSTKVPIDTPASVKSTQEDHFKDFGYNYMDDPEAEAEADIDIHTDLDVRSDEENNLEEEQDLKQTKEKAKKNDLVVEVDNFVLSHTKSMFNIGNLRPDQASDFIFSTTEQINKNKNDSPMNEASDILSDDTMSIEEVVDQTVFDEEVNKATKKSTDMKDPQTLSTSSEESIQSVQSKESSVLGDKEEVQNLKQAIEAATVFQTT